MAKSVRKHEVSFCADVQSMADALIARNRDWPFERAHVETYGTGSDKRSDLQFLGRDRTSPLVTGEVRMPGTAEGRRSGSRCV